MPASEDTLILYVADLAQSKAPSTIRTYLSGVRHLHVINGLGNPLEGKLRLELALKGVRRRNPRPSCPRLLVTPVILAVIKRTLDTQPGFDATMLWAACCLGFFGFLRSGEFTLPSASAFDATKHLTAGDVAVDSHTNPTILAVRLKVTKTDPFGEGITIYLGKTAGPVCPVSALLQYLARRPPREGPLFIDHQGNPLTKASFTRRLRETLTRAGIDPSRYKGHSFRIGAATTAAACGISDSLIKTLGRWRSEAYQAYIRIPASDLASISTVLVRDPPNTESTSQD